MGVHKEVLVDKSEVCVSNKYISQYNLNELVKKVVS